MQQITFRPGGTDDNYATFRLSEESINDLGQRHNMIAISGGDDPAGIEGLWQRRRPMFEHLTETVVHFWIAEKDGDIIGYSRSILRDAVLQIDRVFCSTP